MKVIRVFLHERLLKAADIAAKRQEQNRSALIRQALREHLKRLDDVKLEARDRRSYQAKPHRIEEYRPSEKIAAWQ